MRYDKPIDPAQRPTGSAPSARPPETPSAAPPGYPSETPTTAPPAASPAAPPPVPPPGTQAGTQTGAPTGEAVPPRPSADATGQAGAPQAAPPGVDGGIWDTARADEFRHRWHDVQTRFVEDPPGSLTEARQLVDEAAQALADSVHQREEQVERAGARSSDSTEGMRDAVLQYHHLLDRLLSV